MAMMNRILAEELDKCCVVYMDNVMIQSQTHEEHAKHLDTILSKLQEQSLYAKAKKCKIAVEVVYFMGH